jgi:hypothetical protein
MWWDVLPDDERLVWDLDPFESVGPLSYGMAPGEVAAAMIRLTDEQQHCFPHPGFKEGRYRQFGLKLYYRNESMAGVAVDALRGPQVFVEGVSPGRYSSPTKRRTTSPTGCHHRRGPGTERQPKGLSPIKRSQRLPSLPGGTDSFWSGWVRDGLDAVPGGGDFLRPGPSGEGHSAGTRGRLQFPFPFHAPGDLGRDELISWRVPRCRKA